MFSTIIYRHVVYLVYFSFPIRVHNIISITKKRRKFISKRSKHLNDNDLATRLNNLFDSNIHTYSINVIIAYLQTTICALRPTSSFFLHRYLMCFVEHVPSRYITFSRYLAPLSSLIGKNMMLSRGIYLGRPSDLGQVIIYWWRLRTDFERIWVIGLKKKRKKRYGERGTCEDNGWMINERGNGRAAR